MTDQVRVFLSHHHSPEEDAFTARLVKDLEAAGADVWVDDQRISSNNFVQKIGEGLEGRQWLVLVMTPQSVASPWVRNEVYTALNEYTAGRMSGVIPVVLTHMPEQEVPLLWRPLHRYDATQDYAAALSGLLNAMELTAPALGNTGSGPEEELISLGMQLLHQEQYSGAVAVFRRATELAPAQPRAWDGLALALNESGLHSEAFDASSRAVLLNSRSASAWNNRAWALIKLERYQDALVDSQRALNLENTHAWAWNTHGWALRMLERYPEALLSFERALELDARFGPAWDNKAVTLHALGRHEEARQAEQRLSDLHE